MLRQLITKIDKYFFPLVLMIIGISLFLRFNHLDQPSRYMFDEDMHAYTANLMAQNQPLAYEWWHPPQVQELENLSDLFYRPPAIEWLHPPISKLLQAASINVLGNQPLAWRLPSALAGVGVVGLIIIVTFSITRSGFISLGAGLLATFEPLLLVQSRIASADIFVTFFGLLTIWLYLKLFILRKDHKDKTHQIDKKPSNHKIMVIKIFAKYWPVILVGASLGLTIASKWSGAFLILGLLGFTIFSYPTLTRKSGHWGRLWQLGLICLVAGLVYLLSYSQMFLQGKNLHHLQGLHRQAFWYQTHTTFSHPYQSRPWQWLIGQKPVWYYHHTIVDGQVTQVVARPWTLITILGFLLIIMLNFSQVFGLKLKKKFLKSDRKSTFIIQFLSWIVLSLYLPWFFISRALFIYQLTPIMPYLILVISVSIYSYFESGKIDLSPNKKYKNDQH